MIQPVASSAHIHAQDLFTMRYAILQTLGMLLQVARLLAVFAYNVLTGRMPAVPCTTMHDVC